MPQALIFDAIRTPRGKGKNDGALHAVKPIALLGGVLRELQRRHDLDTAQVDATGPMPATRKALAKAQLTLEQIDLFEVNEAFAAVPLRWATGAMLLGTLLDKLERRKLRYGLATLCVGGGMGIATVVERF